MGDLLFAIANLSRKLGIEPEAALRRATEKFTTRFETMERAFAERGRPLSEATLEEMEAEWQRVKFDGTTKDTKNTKEAKPGNPAILRDSSHNNPSDTLSQDRHPEVDEQPTPKASSS